MVRFLRLFSVITAVGIAALVIPKLIFFLEQDDCLDSGGALNSAGVCEVATGHYSPIFGPQTPYIVWLLLFGLASMIVFGISRALLRIAEKVFIKSNT